MRGRRDPHDDPAPAGSQPRGAVSVPTLGALLHQPYWCWLRCDACGHSVAVALVPFVIRWGADASSDMLRRHARCTVCGRSGATLRHPSWGDAVVGGPWLKGEAGTELLRPAAEDRLRMWAVSRRVNKTGTGDDDPTLLDEVAE